MRERQPASQHGLVTPRDRADALAQVRERQHGRELCSELVDEVARRIGKLIIKRLGAGRAETVREATAQNLAVRHPALSDEDILVADERL